RGGALLQATVDPEVLVHLIARSREPTVELQLADALSRLAGAFSVILTVGETLYAARDPWGYRPLIMGRLPDGGVAIASETCALDLIGARNHCTLGPGEVVRVEGDEITYLPRLEGAERQ